MQPKELLEKYLSDSMTKEEQDAFRALLAREDLQEDWASAIACVLEEKRFDAAPGSDKDAIFQQIISATPVYPYPIPTLHRYRWWAAAAVLLLLLGAGTLWLRKPHTPPAMATTDVAPGGSKAMLTLANGEVVALDSAGSQAWQQGNTHIRQAGGMLAYTPHGSDETVSYNTLTTPRGGQFRLTLPDGSQVWLNAASSLRYPTAFNGSDRLVEVQGEAYFDIAQDARHPFKVKINNQTTIVVLGTSFNINAYANEPTISTTLLTGAVKMLHRDQQVTLAPGQQAQISQQQGIAVNNNIDTAQISAWKNGLFNFHNATLPEVMRQLTRWYDIEVVYEGNIPTITFDGKMDKHLSLSQIIKIFSYMKLNCRLEENRRLVVLP